MSRDYRIEIIVEPCSLDEVDAVRDIIENEGFHVKEIYPFREDRAIGQVLRCSYIGYVTLGGGRMSQEAHKELKDSLRGKVVTSRWQEVSDWDEEFTS